MFFVLLQKIIYNCCACARGTSQSLHGVGNHYRDLAGVPAHMTEHAVVLLKRGMRTADKLINGNSKKQHCP